MRTIRLALVAALLLIASVFSQALPARALAPLPVPDSVWFGNNNVDFQDRSIGAVPYRHAVAFHLMNLGYYSGSQEQAEVSLNVQLLRGYNAVRVQLGLADGGTNGVLATIAVDRDGVPYRVFKVKQGMLALPAVIPFGGHRVLHFFVQAQHPYPVGGAADMILGAPTAVLQGAHGPGTGPSVSLALGATTVQPGALLPISVTTAPSAPVTLVISYPGGGQQVIGPTPAPASGKFNYTLRVPATVHGTVGVVAVTGGVVSQASFTAG